MLLLVRFHELDMYCMLIFGLCGFYCFIMTIVYYQLLSLFTTCNSRVNQRNSSRSWDVLTTNPFVTWHVLVLISSNITFIYLISALNGARSNVKTLYSSQWIHVTPFHIEYPPRLWGHIQEVVDLGCCNGILCSGVELPIVNTAFILFLCSINA